MLHGSGNSISEEVSKLLDCYLIENRPIYIVLCIDKSFTVIIFVAKFVLINIQLYLVNYLLSSKIGNLIDFLHHFSKAKPMELHGTYLSLWMLTTWPEIFTTVITIHTSWQDTWNTPLKTKISSFSSTISVFGIRVQPFCHPRWHASCQNCWRKPAIYFPYG